MTGHAAEVDPSCAATGSKPADGLMVEIRLTIQTRSAQRVLITGSGIQLGQEVGAGMQRVLAAQQPHFYQNSRADATNDNFAFSSGVEVGHPMAQSLGEGRPVYFSSPKPVPFLSFTHYNQENPQGEFITRNPKENSHVR